MYYQTSYSPGIINYLRKNKVKVIVLLRGDVVRNSLSALRARSTGIHHYNGHNHLDQLPRLTVDFNKLEQKIKRTEAFNKQLHKLSQRFDSKIMYYEDFENWDQTISSLLNYIGVSDIPLKPATKKLNPENLTHMIENHEDLKTWLLSNGYNTSFESTHHTINEAVKRY